MDWTTRARRRPLTGLAAGATTLAAAALLTQNGADAAKPESPIAAYSVFAAPAQTADMQAGTSFGDGTGITRAIGGLPGYEAWATVSDSQICVGGFTPGHNPEQITPANSCAAPDAVRADGGSMFILSGYTPRKGAKTVQSLNGLVPDRASVTLTLADGSTQNLRVVRNGVEYQGIGDSARPTKIVVTADDVTLTKDLGDTP